MRCYSVIQVHEPTSQFRETFYGEHERNIETLFRELLRESGVDENENKQLIQHLNIIEEKLKSNQSSKFWWQTLRITLVLISLTCAYLTYTYQVWVWLTGVLAPLPIIFFILNGIIKESQTLIDDLEHDRDSHIRRARQQMAPLNALYDWHQALALVSQTLPVIAFDSVLTSERLSYLRTFFGWDDSWNTDKSIKCVHSALLYGNPVLLTQYIQHWIGFKPYQGSLRIDWTEQVRNSKGNWETQTRSETLNATVTKPFPEYADRTEVLHFHDAARNLVFSRQPSGMPKNETGWLGKVVLWWKKNQLRKEATNTKRNFTPMANQDFDAIFAALDRNHDLEFRLLFTVLAQQEILKVLRDSEHGFGDDFKYTKRNMVTFIEPEHMNQVDFSCNPAIFHSYDLGAARRFFRHYHAAFFKSLYFGIAPLLSIPEYHLPTEHRTVDDSDTSASFWEMESVSNHRGDSPFQHPQCVTRNLIKTSQMAQADGSQSVSVTAYGYMGTPRVDYVTVRGGDQNYHDVPVHWTEYNEVTQTSSMRVMDASFAEASTLTMQGSSPAKTVQFKSLLSVILG